MSRFIPRHKQRWVIGLLLVLALGALRLPWREADGGNDSFWAYGFFNTDEGWYTSGGRLAYLTGHFLDPEMKEPLNYLLSWGMYVLSYFGYCLAGLTWGAIRWPTMVAAICGWLSVFVLVSRRTTALVAGLVVFLASCNPASLTYERVASSDVIVGAFCVTALALATSRRQWPAAAAGAIMAVALSVKPTALGLLPLVLLGACWKRHRRWQRLLFLCLSLVTAFAASLAVRQACLQAAARGGGTAPVVEALAIQMFGPGELTHRFADCFKAVFVFPRCPISLQLGPFVIWCFALPMFGLLLTGLRTGRLVNRSSVVRIGALVYLAICSTQATNCLRHLLPVLYLAPVLVVDARASAPRRSPFSSGHCLAVVLAIAVLFALYWLHPRHTIEQLQGQLYNEYKVPAHGPWRVAGIPLAAGSLVVTIALWLGLRDQASLKRKAFFAALGLSFVWWFFNNYTVSLMQVSGLLVSSQLVFQCCLCAMSATLVVGGRWRGGKHWYLVQAVILIAFLTGNGLWSAGYSDLWIRHFHVRDAGRQLAQLVPPNGIVVGRRATTLLRTSQARLGMTSSNYNPKEFVEKIAALLDEYPSCPLYWLVDGDGNAPWQWDAYRQWGQDRWKVHPIATALLPSGDVFSTENMPEAGNLAVVPVTLFRITKIR